MKERKNYISPICEVFMYAPRLNNSYDPTGESGLVSVSGNEIDASLGEGKEISFEGFADENGDVHKPSLWED